MKYFTACCLILSGCAQAHIVNYPGKDVGDKNAPVTSAAKPGVVWYKTNSVAHIKKRRADAYEIMFDACGSTKYTILSDAKDPGDPYRWLITFKCD